MPCTPGTPAWEMSLNTSQCERESSADRWQRGREGAWQECLLLGKVGWVGRHCHRLCCRQEAGRSWADRAGAGGPAFSPSCGQREDVQAPLGQGRGTKNGAASILCHEAFRKAASPGGCKSQVTAAALQGVVPQRVLKDTTGRSPTGFSSQGLSTVCSDAPSPAPVPLLHPCSCRQSFPTDKS